MPLDAEGYDPNTDYVCATCGRLHHGPHAGLGIQVDDATNVGHIDFETGKGYPTSPEHPGNFSHGLCPECYHQQMADYHRERRFKRGKHG